MLMSRTGWTAAMLATAVLFFGAHVRADKPQEKTETEKTADLVEQLALAGELTAFGRGELAESTGLKDFKSPEALVAAGGILLRIHKQTGGKVQPAQAQVMDEEGTAVPEEKAVSSLAEEAAALFDEARAMPMKDPKALEVQIKQAETVPERGASGGPKVINRTVKSGKKHKIELAFEPNSPATVTMRGSGRVKFEVIGPGGKVLWHSQGSWGTYHWQAGKASERGITVKVINDGGPAVAYTVTTN